MNHIAVDAAIDELALACDIWARRRAEGITPIIIRRVIRGYCEEIAKIDVDKPVKKD